MKISKKSIHENKASFIRKQKKWSSISPWYPCKTTFSSVFCACTSCGIMEPSILFVRRICPEQTNHLDDIKQKQFRTNTGIAFVYFFFPFHRSVFPRKHDRILRDLGVWDKLRWPYWSLEISIPKFRWHVNNVLSNRTSKKRSIRLYPVRLLW